MKVRKKVQTFLALLSSTTRHSGMFRCRHFREEHKKRDLHLSPRWERQSPLGSKAFVIQIEQIH
jgi:hypothetical protein